SMGPEYLGKPSHPDVEVIIESSMKKITAAKYATGSTAGDNNIERWVSAGGRMFLCSFQGYIQTGLTNLKTKATGAES
ncbi:MAG: hypothetical protein OSB66_04285, partial [SAR202 cluster bacterium]|nr:hypothetical protein [SAR202 cluster bacterium]